MKHVRLSCLGILTVCALALTSSVFAFDVIVPDTGQTFCYDWEYRMCDVWHWEGSLQVCDSTPYCPEENEDFYGQDANYLINPPSLSDNGNGIITDNLTGLMWEKSFSSTVRTWAQALTYAEGLTLAGFDDWHLPNINQLESITSPSATLALLSAAAGLPPASTFNLVGFATLGSGTTGGGALAPGDANYRVLDAAIANPAQQLRTWLESTTTLVVDVQIDVDLGALNTIG